MEHPEDLSDVELFEAYERTNGEPGNPEVEALLAEIKRRNLDI